MKRIALVVAAVAALIVAGGFRRPRSSGGAVATTLNLDLTGSTLPSSPGLIATRASKTGAIYAMQTPTTATSVTGDDVYDCATTNTSLCGHWAFGPYSNLIPNAAVNDLTNAAYTKNGTPTVTANFSTGPDGTLTASRVLDNSASVVQSVYITAGTTGVTRDNAVASAWIRDDATTPPTTTGALGSYFGDTRIYWWTIGQHRPFPSAAGSGNAWRRVSHLGTTPAATLGNSGFDIIPTGYTPVEGAYGTVDIAQTGGVNVWGAFRHDGFVDYPLVLGSTGQLTLTGDSTLLGLLLDANGDLDVEVGYVGEYFFGGASADGDGWIFSMATPSKGTIGVTKTNMSAHSFMVNGSSIMSNNFGNDPMTSNGASFGAGEEKVRVSLHLSTGTAYMRAKYNGCFENVVQLGGQTGTIGTPTSFYLGSNLGANVYERRFTSVRAYKSAETLAGTTSLYAAEGAMIGDSTSSSYSTVLTTLCEWIYTVGESRTRLGIDSLAVTGQRADQQLAAWQGSPSRGDSKLRWVYIMVGINDILQGATEATTTGRIQSIINDINTNNPGAKILLAPMTPPTTFTTGQKAIWNAVNADIEGIGSPGTVPITGSNLVRLGAWTALNDGSDNLKVQYQMPGDTLHENDSARQLMATTIRSTLQSTTCGGSACL